MFLEDLKKGIIDTYVVSSHGEGETDSGNLENGNFDSIDKLYLLSSEEIFENLDENNYESSTGMSR